MKAEVISVGTELLLGQIVDTNSVFIAQKLAQIGVDLYHKATVGDNEERLEATLRSSLARSEVVILTGGLGPTIDDITVKTVAKTLGRQLVLNEKVLAKIENFFKARGLPMSSNNVKQALIPIGATIIDNPVGTAPGLIMTHDGKVIILLPGVPLEMKAMMEDMVIPFLREKTKGSLIRSKILKVTGMGESAVDEKIKDLLALSNPTIGLLAYPGEVHVRITAKGEEREADKMIAEMEKMVLERLGDNVFGVDNQTLEEVVGALLTLQKRTISVAESCTGGLTSNRLTNIPGSSNYFEMGIVAYSNRAKIELLKVPEETIRNYGAVSSSTAIAMAKGIRELRGTDLGLGVTGLAGPKGGTPEKPVGLVYIALASERGISWKEFRFSGDRETIKRRTSQAALDLVRRSLLG